MTALQILHQFAYAIDDELLPLTPFNFSAECLFNCVLYPTFDTPGRLTELEIIIFEQPAGVPGDLP